MWWRKLWCRIVGHDTKTWVNGGDYRRLVWCYRCQTVLEKS